jgi:hypothetical protein
MILFAPADGIISLSFERSSASVMMIPDNTGSALVIVTSEETLSACDFTFTSEITTNKEIKSRAAPKIQCSAFEF